MTTSELTMTASDVNAATSDVNAATAMSIEIENLKCGGCEKSILKALKGMAEITDPAIDRENNRVNFRGNHASREAVANKLRALGYPEKDSLRGFDAGVANVKSFVSCAIGRLS